MENHREKSEKTWSITKKMSSEIFGVKIEIFSLKQSFRNLSLRNVFPSPPNSAPGLRLWHDHLPVFKQGLSTPIVFKPN